MGKGRLQVEATPLRRHQSAKPATLSFVDNTVDNTTGTIKLKGTFANPDHRLWPGQFSNVSLRLAQQENATIVPSQAVQTGQIGRLRLCREHPIRRAEQRPVKVARTVGGDSVIANGVQPGETVVTDGQLRLIPGIKVQVRSRLQRGAERLS